MLDSLTEPRIVKFIKNERAITASVYENSPQSQYQARILIFPNFGETKELYSQYITELTSKGFVVTFYNRVVQYIDVEDASKEFNRAVKLCIDEMDDQGKTLPNHKLHVLGAGLAASEIIYGGINGYFKHRVKSIIVINPYLKEFHSGTLKWVNSRIHLWNVISTGISNESMTSDSKWLEYLKKNGYQFDEVGAFYFRHADQTIKKLRKRKYLRQFSIKNMILVHSKDDEYRDIENLALLIDNIEIDSPKYLEYENGKMDLLLEGPQITKQLLNDILQWLKDI